MIDKFKEQTVGTKVILFNIDLSKYGGEIIYFTTSKFDYGNIIFEGNTYQNLPIEAEGFEWSGKGTFPKPILKITNIKGIFSSILLENNDLLGAKVERIITPNKKKIDNLPLSLKSTVSYG